MNKTTKLANVAFYIAMGGCALWMFVGGIAQGDFIRLWWGRVLVALVGIGAVMLISRGVCIWESLRQEKRADEGSS